MIDTRLKWEKHESERRWESVPRFCFIKQHTRDYRTVTRLFRYDPTTSEGYKVVSVPQNIRAAKSEAQELWEIGAVKEGKP